MATILGRVTVNGIDLLEVDQNPGAAGGTSASLGSIASDSSTGTLYSKTGALDTDWTPVGTGSGGIQTTFVYRPGGVASDNVYTDWALLMADLMGVQGPKIVELDDRFGAISIPAGGPYDMRDTTIRGRLLSGTPVVVTVDPGASFENLERLEWLRIDYTSATPAVVVPAGLQYFRMWGASIQNGGAAPFFDLTTPGAVLLSQLQNASGFNPFGGASPVVDLGATGFFSFSLDEASTNGVDTVAGTAGSNLTITLRDASAIFEPVTAPTFTGTFAGVNLRPLAQNTSYDPALLPSGLSADTVQDAIDELATGGASNIIEYTPGAAGPLRPNQYTSWSDAHAAATRARPSTIMVDDTDGAAQIPAGAWDMDGITLSALVTADTLPIPVITAQDGATLPNLGVVSGPLTLTTVSLSPVLTVPAGIGWLRVYQANLQASASSPLIEVPAGSQLFLDLKENGSLIEFGGGPVVSLPDPTSAMRVFLGELAGVGPGTIDAVPGAPVVLNIQSASARAESTAVVGGASPSFGLVPDSIFVSYDPALLPSGLTSTTVQDAIDELAVGGAVGITDGDGDTSITVEQPAGTDTDTTVFTNSGAESMRISSAGALLIGTAAPSGDELLAVAGDARIAGNLLVEGTTTSFESETVRIADNHLYLNDGYETGVAQTGGLVVNYLPSGTVLNVDVGGFTAGVGGMNNPTVEYSGFGLFTPGRFIQISGAARPENNGLFELLSASPTTITIRGVGLTATTEDFTQNQFVTDATAQGTIAPVTVSVIRSGTDGMWEVGAGSTAPLSFLDVLTSAALPTDHWQYGGNTVGSEQSIGTNDAFDFVIETNGVERFRIDSATPNILIAAGPSNTTTTIGIGNTAFAIGNSASANGFGNGFAIGFNANASGGSSIALGPNTVASQTGAVAIGDNADATTANAAALGVRAMATGGAATAFGSDAQATQLFTVALGALSQATGDSAIAIGGGSTTQATGTSAIAIGRQADAGFDDSVSLGRDSASTAANQFMVGATSRELNAFINGTLTLNSSVAETLPVATYTTLGVSGDSVQVFVGQSDPSAGGGVVAPVGSLFHRDSGGTGTVGELYLKTGATDTDWSSIGAAGGPQDLATTLTIGNVTGGTDMIFTSGDQLLGETAAAGGPLSIFGGNGTLTDGGAVTISGGTGAASNDGGAVSISGGTSGGGGVGGALTLSAGSGTTAGTATLQGGLAGSATTDGGSVVVQGRTSGGTSGTGGSVSVLGGAGANGGGDITITAGTGFLGGSVGGNLALTAGDGVSTGGGFAVVLGDGATPGVFSVQNPGGVTTPIVSYETTGTNGDAAQVFVGDIDPSAVGLVAPVGSILHRDVGGAGTSGELWVKTGSANTAWSAVGTAAGNSLQQAYDAGNTIVTSLAEGPLDVSGDQPINLSADDASIAVTTTTAGNISLSAASDVDVDAIDVLIDATGGLSLDAAAASNFTVDGANLSLTTTTSGLIILNSANAVDISASTSFLVNAATSFEVDASANSRVTVSGADLTMESTASGNVVASSADFFIVETGGSERFRIDSTTPNITIAAGPANTFTSISIGNAAFAIGSGATANGFAGGFGIGFNATASGGNSLALGPGTTAPDTGSVALGDSSNATGANSLAIGTRATTSVGAIALGVDTDATALGAVALGLIAQATANDAISLGRDASAGFTESVALGRDATTTVANQFMVGDPARELNTVINGTLALNSTVAESSAVASYTTNGANGDSVEVFVGQSDPSAPAGITAPVGSLFHRDVTGAGTSGELYLKTGAADTDWTQVATGDATEAESVRFAVNQVAHGFSVLDPIGHNGTQFILAQADNAATLGLWVVVEVIDVDNFVAAQSGRIEIPAHGLTLGSTYFVSAAVAGQLTAVPPSAVGEFINPLVFARETNVVDILPFRPTLNEGPPAADSLQEAYEAGNSIITDSTNGNFDVSGTEAISLDAQTASNFTVDGANLTLSTLTAGAVLVNSATFVNIDANGSNGVSVTGGSPGSGAGGAVNLTGGASADASDAGDVQLSGGNASGTGLGGDIVLLGGAGAANSGGAVTVTAGSSSPGSLGSLVNITGGIGDPGGDVLIQGGNVASGTSDGGGVLLRGANGGATSGNGGSVTVNTGDAADDGGNFVVTCGQSANAGTGGEITLTAGDSAVGAGGDVTLVGGNAFFQNGGNILLSPGTGAPAGVVGIGAINSNVELNITGTGAVRVPSGTTAQRPGTPPTGAFRLNTQTGIPESYNGTTWVQMGGMSPIVFKPQDSQPPASVPAATLSTRGVARPQPLVAFDPNTNEETMFVDFMPASYGGGDLVATVVWASTTTGGSVEWGLAFERQDDGVYDLDAVNFAALRTAVGPAPGTSGVIVYTTISFTNAQADGVQPGECFRVRLIRNATSGNDTNTGDAQVVRVIIEESI